MAHILEHDRTEFFTVVGAPPIAEEHQDARSHYYLDAIGGTTGAVIAGVWFALYVGILVAAIAGKGNITRAVGVVTAALAQ